MIQELAPLRMALDEYDAAVTLPEREAAEHRIRSLLAVGLLRIIIRAVDEPDLTSAEDDDDSAPV